MSLKIMTEVWEQAPEELTPAQLILLLRLADGAGEHRMVWESVDTFAKRCRQSRRTVFSGLKRLKELSIIEDVPEAEWPREARLYSSVVRRIRPVNHWGAMSRHPAGAGVRNLHPPAERVTPELRVVAAGGADFAPNPESYSSLDNPTGYPSRRRRDVDEVPSRRAQMSAQAAREKELDPAKMLGLDSPQPVSHPASRRRPSPNSAMGLALDFKKCLYDSGIPLGPNPVNLTALAKNFRQWTTQGITPDDIRSMYALYLTVPGLTNPLAAPWLDLLSKRHHLLGLVRQSAEHTAAQSPEYWQDTPVSYDQEQWA